MSTWLHRPHRLAAGIGVCIALCLLATSCARDAFPGEAGPHFTGERAGALEPGTVPTDTAAATPQSTAPLPATGSAATQPAAEETAVSPVPDPGSSPAPSSSEPPPIEPVVPEVPADAPEAPAEDPEATSTQVASPDTEDPQLSAGPDSGAPLIEEPSEPQDVATAGADQQTSGNTTTGTDQQPPDDATAESVVEHVESSGELPGGGLPLFEPGDGRPARRLVAAYGHPSSGALGVLGEQGPEEAVERLRSIAEGYGADGSAVLPTFEIIATVASASASPDGDYSRFTDREAIRPWIEVATANGVYVVLDLQPGRSDFLSQAKYYEEFLRLPHVGLALDPEWRLKPNQVHLRQIGTVDAAEVNQVVDWLAGIVREEALPQKLLIVHQFRLSMITNREQIETPPELAVLIHMDGQGSLGAKYNTWNTLTGQADADRFYWGWKNFYDEDRPMAAPEQVLELSPRIVFVSFQ